MFAHSIRNHICTRIEQYRTFQLVWPVIIVCHSSKTCFDTAQNDRCLFISLTNQISIDYAGIVRSFSHLAARCIGVCLSSLFGYRIMIYHRIHISCRDKKSKSWFSEHLHALRLTPVRLCNNPNTISSGFQKTCNDCVTKRWMIDIGISWYIDKIYLIPSSLFHLFSGNW